MNSLERYRQEQAEKERFEQRIRVYTLIQVLLSPFIFVGFCYGLYYLIKYPWLDVLATWLVVGCLALLILASIILPMRAAKREARKKAQDDLMIIRR